MFDYEDFEGVLSTDYDVDYEDMMKLGFSLEELPEELPEETRKPTPKRKRVVEEKGLPEKFVGEQRKTRKTRKPRHVPVRLARRPIPYTSQDSVGSAGSVVEHMCNLIFGVAHLARFPGLEGCRIIDRMVCGDEATMRYVIGLVRQSVSQGSIFVGCYDKGHGFVEIDREAIRYNGNTLPARINGGNNPSDRTVSKYCVLLERQYRIKHRGGSTVGHLARISCQDTKLFVLFEKKY